MRKNPVLKNLSLLLLQFNKFREKRVWSPLGTKERNLYCSVLLVFLHDKCSNLFDVMQVKDRSKFLLTNNYK
jgi:hypothetical protein